MNPVTFIMNKSRWGTLAVLGLLLLCFTVWLTIQPSLALKDSAANSTFGLTARQLQIKGKTFDFILAHFGKPYSKYANENGDEVWLYVPGPKLAIWNSTCKIIFDKETRLVVSWGVDSD